MLCIVTEAGVLDDGKKIYTPGEKIDLEEAEALRLADMGRVKVTADVAQAVTVDALVELIQAFDRDDKGLWTGGGKPSAAVLSELAGHRVSANDRDAAWEIVIKMESGE